MLAGLTEPRPDELLYDMFAWSVVEVGHAVRSNSVRICVER